MSIMRFYRKRGTLCSKAMAEQPSPKHQAFRLFAQVEKRMDRMAAAKESAAARACTAVGTSISRFSRGSAVTGAQPAP